MVEKITVTITTELTRYGEVVFSVKSHTGIFKSKCLHDALSDADIKMTGITEMVDSTYRQLKTTTHYALETIHTRLYDREERRSQSLNQALTIMQQQLKLVFQTFQSNVEAALQEEVKRINLSYLNVFKEFNVPLSTLVSITLEISPTCLMTDQKFSRKRPLVVPRQLLCYIASEMGYTDPQIAYVINRDRTTVIAAKKTVLDALTYNTADYIKTMKLFTTRLKNYQGGEVLQYLD